MSASTSPLPYTGNKSCIVNTILTVMPKHSVYIEPCMGSAEVFFRKPKAEREILNDYNGDLVNLFRTIQSNKKLVFLLGRLYLSINSELVFRQNAVIQVGKGNSYGHPTEDTLSKLRDACVKVYRNDLQGTIICSSDGETVFFGTEKNESVQTNPTVTTTSEPNDVGEYIGNKNSKKFHLPTCKNLPAEKNRVFFGSRQEAVDAGFDPCGNCKP